MTYHDPKEAIVEFLSHPPQPYAKVMQKDGLIARAETIRFLKECSVAHHQIHAVRFESETGQQQDCFCLVHQNESGLWQSGNIAFSGEGKRAEKETSHPRVVFSGGGRDPWSAGGHVIDNGFEVARIRLISNNGLVFEDQVEHGLVLFLTDQPVQRPVEAKLYNRSSMLVGTQTAFPALPPEWGKP